MLPGLRTVRIDIDPTEMVRRKADAGLVTDAASGTAALLDALGDLPARPSIAAECTALRARAAEDLRMVQPQEAYLRVIREVLRRDGFLVEEVSQVGFTARMCFPVYAPRQYFTCGYQDNLGFGFNTALSVKVANPDKAVVSVSGDGGFLFGVQELATARQFRDRRSGDRVRQRVLRQRPPGSGADLWQPPLRGGSRESGFRRAGT